MSVKLTIAIPVYNSEKTIADSIESALSQEYPLKEVLVIDDCSTDRTVEIVKKYPVRLIENPVNLGIGRNLKKLMDNAEGKYVVYLCGDDQFTHEKVCNDIVHIFDTHSDVGVIGRFYYQYMDGYDGPIMVCRDMNILTSSCNPSGMAFRNMAFTATNDIFIEMPSVVLQYLEQWRWTLIEYDTIKARIHPGGNTGTKKEYYQGSQVANWAKLMGEDFRFNQGFIQIKNRASHLLWQEIKNAWNLTPGVRVEPSFYFYAGIALLVPSCILKPLSNFYRHRITRRFCKIIPRSAVCIS